MLNINQKFKYPARHVADPSRATLPTGSPTSGTAGPLDQGLGDAQPLTSP
jgi:hypothetical protein